MIRPAELPELPPVGGYLRAIFAELRERPVGYECGGYIGQPWAWPTWVYGPPGCPPQRFFEPEPALALPDAPVIFTREDEGR